VTKRAAYGILPALLPLLLAGCLNPFAPMEGEAGSESWSPQLDVGGLLHNFALAYDYRDSLRYADCLDKSFVFSYYDVERGRFDSWFRDADLKATGGLFRTYDRIDLEWNMVPEDARRFNLPDSTLAFIVRFNLTLGDEAPLMGYARFSVRMSDDRRFRVMQWQDDF